MRLLTCLDNNIADLDDCTTDSQLKHVSNKFTLIKLPLSDLVSSCSKAILDINRAIKSLTPTGPKGKSKGSKGKGGQTGSGGVGQHIGQALFEYGPSAGHDMVVIEEAELQKMDELPPATKPFLMKCDKEEHSKLMAHAVLDKYITDFCGAMNKQEAKVRKELEGRTSAILPEAAEAVVLQRVKKTCPFIKHQSDFKGPDRCSVLPLLQAQVFGILHNVTNGGVEKEFGGCVRINVAGNRKIIATPFTDLFTFMMEKKVLKAGDFNINTLRDFFLKMDADELNAYSKHGEVHHATIDAGSTFFPAG